MKLLSRISIVVLAILVVSLAMTTLAFSKRSQDLTTQLQRAQTELQTRRGRHRLGASTSSEWLSQSLNEQEQINTQLRGELARLKQPASHPALEGPATPPSSPSEPAGRNGPGAWMERLRQEDPERYKQYVEQ